MRFAHWRAFWPLMAFLAGGWLAESGAQTPGPGGTVVNWGLSFIPYAEPGTRYVAISAGGCNNGT
jgi:hypothetical protein